MLNDKEILKRKKTNVFAYSVCVYRQTYLQQNKKEILMKITVLIPITDHVVINTIYNHLPLPNLYFLCLLQVLLLIVIFSQCDDPKIHT